MLARIIMMGVFSVTAVVLFSYQGIEISHAIASIFNKKEY